MQITEYKYKRDTTNEKLFFKKFIVKIKITNKLYTQTLRDRDTIQIQIQNKTHCSATIARRLNYNKISMLQINEY